MPSESIGAIRNGLADVVESVLEAVGTENPVYAEVLRDPAGLGIRLGIEQAINTFLTAVETGQAPAGETDEVWRRLGEAEFQAGRSLDALRAAFRTGTRAVWRSAAGLASEAGIETATVIALAEGIFVYSDALAAEVVEGYLQMRSDEAGEIDRRRRRLGLLLLDPAGHDHEALERAAEPARWPLPRELAVLALAGDSPAPVARRLDVDVLAGAGAEGSWLVLPDPRGPGRVQALRRAVAAAGIAAALGGVVAPIEAHRSLRWARAALSLIEQGGLPDERPTRVEDHLGVMILAGDRRLAELLAANRLAPFARLGAAERERLLETLEAWLAHQRHVPEIAEALHVHPQTVRYRLGKLRELLGEVLEDPDGRFELQLALRARDRLPT